MPACLQVQVLALRTFLTRAWTADLLAQLPATFLTSTLLPALLQPQHYRDSKQQQVPLEQLASSFLTAYIAAGSGQRSQEVLAAWLATLASSDLPMAALQASLHCLRDAAQALLQQEQATRAAEAASAAWRELALQQLAAAAAAFAFHNGAEYRLHNYKLVLQVGTM